jgi:hypothetical protein
MWEGMRTAAAYRHEAWANRVNGGAPSAHERHADFVEPFYGPRR